jgi:hypothetical protein
VICLCNDESAEPTALALRVADIYLADQFETPPQRPVVVANSDEAPASPAAGLAVMKGLYREPVTHAIARATAGGPGLRVDWGYSESAYAPLDRTTFRSTDREGGFAVDLVFSESRRGQLDRFQITQFAKMPLNFARIEAVAPSLDQLRAYTGTYYSEELDATHRIALEDGQLYARYRNAPHTPLEPTQRDRFTLGAARIEFDRDAQGGVSGYGVWYDWSWNVRFVRRDDASTQTDRDADDDREHAERREQRQER